MPRQRLKLGGLRGRAGGQHGFDETLADHIGKAPVWRRGMHVVADGQPEVACDRRARQLQRVLAAAQQLDDSQREVRECAGLCSGTAPGRHPAPGSVPPAAVHELAGQPTIRSQCSGVRSTRRIEAGPLLEPSRRHAVGRRP